MVITNSFSGNFLYMVELMGILGQSHFYNNNEAATIMSSFNEDEAVHVHGLPDLDSDNVDVWCYMVEQHSSTFAVITGSPHND